MSERPINERDRTLGKLEGKIESLATKDFVREQNAEINRQIAELNRQVAQQIAQQTKELQEAIESINEKVEGVKNRQAKFLGGLTAIGFALSLIIGALNIAIAFRAM